MKILIVEDDKGISDFVIPELEHEGYSTCLAVTGREALEKFKIANPDFFVIENVKGMLTLNKGAFVKDLIERFGPNGLGYNISYQLLNAADYGVPQARERVIIIGNKIGVKNSYPKKTHTNKDKKSA